MGVKKSSNLFWITVLLLSPQVILSHAAIGALGDTSESLELDRKIFRAGRQQLRSTRSFVVHEFTNPHHTIREYEKNGVIFAVTWEGERHPDLGAILGKYLVEYQDLLSTTPRIRGQRSGSVLQNPSLVIERSGHMRAIRGRAYAPKLIPKGINLNDIQ